jgi:Fe-S oxidoreductase
MPQLEDFRHSMESCNHCGQCKWVLGPKTKGHDFAEICPIHMQFHFDAYSGQGLLHIAQELLNGELAPEPGLRDLVYACTTCGACDVNCKSIRDMEVLDTIYALRARLVESAAAPLPAHQAQADAVSAERNLYGAPHRARADWANGDPRCATNAAVAYFAGCAAAYRQPDVALNTVRILEAAGIEFSILGPDEQCCGGPLWRTGQVAAAAEQVRANLSALARRGVKTIITSCAECFGTLRGFYPRIADFPFEVRHISQVVQDAIESGQLTFTRRVEETVTWHDPCLLGRLSEPFVPWHGTIDKFGYHTPPKSWRRGHEGVYDAPRRVLGAIGGIRVVEMPRNEENALCCGGGGGVREAFPDQARTTACERLREAASTGATEIVSSCPFCRDTLTDALDPAAGLRYRDFTQLVVDAL